MTVQERDMERLQPKKMAQQKTTVREVNALMRLLQKRLQQERERLLKRNLRLTIIGDLEDLPTSIRDLLTETVEMTRHKDGLIVNLALSYGGRSGIVAAARANIARIERGTITKNDIN